MYCVTEILFTNTSSNLHKTHTHTHVHSFVVKSSVITKKRGVHMKATK